MKTAVKSPPPTSNSKPAPLARVDRRLAILLFALSLGIYSRTLAPGLLFGDAGEFQFAAWRFGLAHPTGYPLYLLLGGSWQHLAGLFGVDPAASLNAFSAVLAAAAVAIFYLAVLGWLPKGSHASRAAAFFAALLMGVNPTLWSQALIAEVYALHALFIALFLLLTGRHTQSPNLPIPQSPSLSPLHLFTLSSLLGLSLTHHRTTLFLLPGFVLWLVWRYNRSATSIEDRNTDYAESTDFRRLLSALIRPIRVIRVLFSGPYWRSGRNWAGLIGGLGLPQLLYLYIPLRSGPDVSPWLYPHLGAETLALYTPTVQGFIDFITGSVFAVSFLSPAQALARIPPAGNLWLVHFTWPGLALALLGLLLLIRQRRWPLLLLTLPAAGLLQIFNLFYGIGDIYVFYIPLYFIAALWAACGAEWLIRLTADRRRRTTDDLRNTQYALCFLLLLTLPASLFVAHFPSLDQSRNDSARGMWDEILAAQPPDDAILVSNDRNEIVPLYYLQAVEGKALGLTGLFPLLMPEERFADVAGVTETALAAGKPPVYLIKAMPGLEVKFAMEQATPPLIRIVKMATEDEVEHRLALAYGPLTLLGYRLDENGNGQTLSLFWRVEEPLAADYTTSVQLFDGAGKRLAQDDRPPGGVFYPTSLWKAGEILRDSHPLPGDGWAEAARLRVVLYTQPDLRALAPALEIDLE